jgi:NADH:ubiquinone oxidoreductase subunit B-like Fe-S oxidoreductase
VKKRATATAAVTATAKRAKAPPPVIELVQCLVCGGWFNKDFAIVKQMVRVHFYLCPECAGYYDLMVRGLHVGARIVDYYRQKKLGPGKATT